MRCCLLLGMLVLCGMVAVSRQQFVPGLVVGAGIALEGAALGYAAGRHRCCRHHHYRRYGYYGRRKRDLTSEMVVTDTSSDVVPAALTPSDPATGQEEDPVLNSVELDAYFRLISAEDVSGCGLRLVCELAAADVTQPEQLLEDEKLILTLFGSNGPKSMDPESPKGPYDFAHHVGLSTGQMGDCTKTFPGCPYDAKTIMDTVRAYRQK